ncbi:hypothetical protein AHAS_Ahas08G0068800 [Arachis hypogaea]
MSKKDREEFLDPVFSLNRFDDVGLGLESESEIGAEKIEEDRIGVEGGKLKTCHGKGGSTWQGKCATLMPPMLDYEIEEELVAEN